MAAKSSTVTVQILADNSQYKREMSETAQVTDKTTKQMGSATDGVGAKMSTFAKVAVAAVAVKALSAVKDFASDSIRSFSDLNESMNAVEVTFGENAEGIKKLGEEAATSLGLSNSEFNSFAVQMSAFAHQIAGDGGDVVGVVDELSTRVSDFASVMNLDVAEAARLFQSGLAGETEPLRRYGIDLSAKTVLAEALASGISDGTTELTEQQKILARHSALMKQTDKTAGDFANTATEFANAQRIANAEMENQKALVGELLVPVKQLTTDLQLMATKALGMAALGFQNLTGDISNVDYALSAFKTHTGEAADSLAAAVTINQKYGITFEELFDRMDLAEGALAPLTASQEKYLESIGYTSEEIDALNELTSAYKIQTDEAARTNTGALVNFQNLTGGVEDLGEATADTTEEIRTQSELLRGLTDPLFNAMEATRDLETAQAEYDATLVNSESTIAEQEAALADLWDAQINLIGAQEDLEAMGPDWKDEFRERGLAMGFPLEEINKIIERVEYLNALAQEGIEIRVKYRAGTEPNLRGGARASGGPVTAGRPYLVGERGPEVVVPSSNGTVIPNNRLGMAGGTVINLTVNALDPNTAARAVVEALQTYNRTNGALPITVRTA